MPYTRQAPLPLQAPSSPQLSAPLSGQSLCGSLPEAALPQLPSPLLYLSLAIKRRQQEYYGRLSAVRTDGDWEGWTTFYLDCVREAADDGVNVCQHLFSLLGRDRTALLGRRGVTIPAIQLLDHLPLQPIVTLARVIELLKTTKPTAAKAIAALEQARILRETTGRKRDRVYAYQEYLETLTRDTPQSPR